MQPGSQQPAFDQFGQPMVQSGTFTGQPQPAVFPVGQQPMMMGGMGYTTTSATAALIFSIIGLVICQPIGIASLIMANKALAITSMSPGHPEHGSAKAAQVISYICIGFLILTIAYIAFIIFMVMENY